VVHHGDKTMLIAMDASEVQVGLALGAASLASIGPTTLMIAHEGLTGGRKLLVASIVWSAQITLIAASLACAGTWTKTVSPAPPGPSLWWS
ncbi:MAG: hypothetical protein ACREWJ_11560, partial [Rhodoferax sp.]